MTALSASSRCPIVPSAGTPGLCAAQAVRRHCRLVAWERPGLTPTRRRSDLEARLTFGGPLPLRIPPAQRHLRTGPAPNPLLARAATSPRPARTSPTATFTAARRALPSSGPPAPPALITRSCQTHAERGVANHEDLSTGAPCEHAEPGRSGQPTARSRRLAARPSITVKSPRSSLEARRCIPTRAHAGAVPLDACRTRHRAVISRRIRPRRATLRHPSRRASSAASAKK